MKYTIAILVAAVVGGSVWTAPADAQAPSRRGRASWLTDQRLVPVGSIVTVVVDERTTARERSSRVANADRRNSMGLSVASPDFTLP